jgi:hypothetical protein
MTEMHPCEICGYIYGQRHRLCPRIWGGEYVSENVAWLCPNHHTAIHLILKWYGRRLENMNENEQARYEAYFCDREFMKFFNIVVKPIVIKRLQAEGLWHPYVRTLLVSTRQSEPV